MDALRWSSEHIEHWDQSYETDTDQTRRMSSLAHGERTIMEETFKAPTMFSHLLREKIMQHPDYLGYTMPVNEYRDLCMFVTSFNKAFHRFRVLVFTRALSLSIGSDDPHFPLFLGVFFASGLDQTIGFDR
jgi:hypothetical protein